MKIFNLRADGFIISYEVQKRKVREDRYLVQYTAVSYECIHRICIYREVFKRQGSEAMFDIEFERPNIKDFEFIKIGVKF